MQTNIETYEKRSNGQYMAVTYSMTTPGSIAKYLVRHPYAWPGGYPLYAITDDGGVLCHTCCKSEFTSIVGSYPNDGWHVIAIDVNYEDTSLYCDHCNQLIESAYGSI